MPTSLVTGGAGFLGSHLCEALLGKGHRVICLDNLETGSLANIEHFRDDAFTFVHHDVSVPIAIDEPLDFVYHLAALASPIDYMRLPLHSLKTGSYGTHHALGLAKWKRARFLLASTSEVYGDPDVHPQPETYWGNVNPIGPRGVYDEAKRYAEALTMAYHRQQGVDTAIVRIFNTYGPRMRPNDGRAIPNFLEPGPRREAADGLRRRLADTLLLLRRRPDPRPDPARRVRRAPAGQHRQPRRVHHPRARRGRHRGDRFQESDPVRGPAGRRPPGAAARHHARASAPRLGAGDRARRGSPSHVGVAREEPGACVGSARRSPRPLSASPSRSHRRPRRPGRCGWGSSTTASSCTASPTSSSRSSRRRARSSCASTCGGPGRASAWRPAGRRGRPTRTTPPTTGTRTTAPCGSRSSTGSSPSSPSSAPLRGQMRRGGGTSSLRACATFACSRSLRSGATAARSSTRTASRFRA